jgi:Mrp family chromosome partitioning ATPase
MRVQAHTDEHNLDRLLGVARRRGIWIVLCVVVAAGVAYALSKRQTKEYTATSSLLFSNNQLSQQIAGIPIGVAGQLQSGSDERLVRVGNMAEETASTLGRGLTATRVAASLSIAQQGETNVVGEASVVEVSVSQPDPRLAAEIANTYSEKFVIEQQRANRHYFNTALAIINKQLASLSPQARSRTAGEALATRAQSLKLLAGLQYNGVELAQRASVPTSPSAPRTSRNTLIGALLGLLLGLGVTLLLERLDGRIRRTRDLEMIYGAPLLGLVPRSRDLAHPEDRYRDVHAVPPGADTDVFGLILAHLRSFNPERTVRFVLVTSAVAGEGKTTIALHLAEAAARAGSRTMLLEMDFRTPTLADRLSIGHGPGLVEVLAGTRSMHSAIHTVGLRTPTVQDADGVTSLDIMLCGDERSSTPAKLLQGTAMDVLCTQVRSEYDLIIVDASALTSISDAFAILPKIDGVVVVDWIGRGSREDAEQLQNVLDRSSVTTLGVIANYATRATSSVPQSQTVPSTIERRPERDKLPT